MNHLLLLSVLLPISAYAMPALNQSAPSLLWATEVHDLMIDLAFPNEDFHCREQMKRGSREVDKMQGSRDAYMHAMRSSEESIELAKQKTWEFIERKYADARRSPTSEIGCTLRGEALHPVMDGTSPAHHGTQEWKPLAHLGQIFEHGGWATRLGNLLPPPINLVIPHSLEDLTYLDDHPEALRETCEIMKTIDRIELELLATTE